MFIHGVSSAASAYAPLSMAPGRQKSVNTFGATGIPASGAQLTLSDQGKAAADADSVQARLDAIMAKPGASRQGEDTAFLMAHDTRFAEIAAKPDGARTADEIDYMQKAGGLVNTMAKLSPDEKKLYDELVAQGNTAAVRGMNLLAMSRMGGGEITLPNGTSFDPSKTAITPENIRSLFSQMFASDDGQDARSFEALASYMETRKGAAA